MFPQSTLTSLGRKIALGTVATLAFAAVGNAQEAPRIISPELFEALESWSESTASIEAVALDQNPEAIIGYSQSLRDVYEGKTLSEHYAAAYPEAHAEYLAMLEAEVVADEDDFAAFAMTHEESYDRWQSEAALEGATFDQFVDRNFPDIKQTVEGSFTPADTGVTMTQHLYDLGREDLINELDTILGTIKGGTKTTCVCWTVATFPHQPDPWQAESPDTYNHSWGWPVKKRKEHSFYTQGRGGAKHFDFYRKSKHTVYEVSRNRTNYDAQMRVRMHCTQSGQLGGAQCEGGQGLTRRPPPVFTLDDAEDHGTDADRGERHADQVDAGGHPFGDALVEFASADDQRQDCDRDVDEEHYTPTEPVDEQRADRRTHGCGQATHRPPGPDGQLPLGDREGRQQQRQARGELRRSADRLHDPGSDQQQPGNALMLYSDFIGIEHPIGSTPS